MIYDILEKKLTDSGLLQAGTTLFRHTMPSDVTIGVMIRPSSGGIAIDPYIKDWHKAQIQVITRHTDPVDGENLAREVCSILMTEGPIEFGTTDEHGPGVLTRFYPQMMPIQYPVLEGNVYEFSQHFDAAFAFESS